METEVTKPTNDDVGALFLGEKDQPDEAALEASQGDQGIEDTESGEVLAADESEEFDDLDEGEEVSAEAEKDDSDEPEDGSELVEVEWEGQLIEAPKSVADALMRNADYTKKTQELAEQRKTYEVAARQVEEIQKAYQFAQESQSVSMEIKQAESLVEQWEQHISQNAKDMDAAQIAQAQLEIKNIERFIEGKRGELSEKQKEFQQAQEQSIRELLDKGTEVLRSRIPGWGEKHIAAVKEYGAANGFTEQELASVVDPRQVEVLWKASQYDKLQAGKTAAVKKVQDAPTIKSKARNPMPKDVQDKLTLRKQLKSNKLSAADKQRLFADDIGKRWG